MLIAGEKGSSVEVAEERVFSKTGWALCWGEGDGGRQGVLVAEMVEAVFLTEVIREDF